MGLVLDETCGSRRTGWDWSAAQDLRGTAEQGWDSYDIFEGTEQIQQLVIARAISGLRIE